MKGSELVLSPPLVELENILHRLITAVVEAAQGLLRVRLLYGAETVPYYTSFVGLYIYTLENATELGERSPIMQLH